MELASAQPTLTTQAYVGGAFRDGSGEPHPTVNPATEQELAAIATSSVEDVDRAVQAARAAFEGVWASTPGIERGRLLLRLADLVERDTDTLAQIEALDVGKPVGQPAMLDVPNAVATLRYFAGWADKIAGQVVPTAGHFGQPTHSFTVREPLGVIGAIVPWNTPLMLATWKIATALAAGNTIVVKPPEVAPLSILHLARLVDEAGFPAGVVNVLPGTGAITGEALVTHPGVDKISFTGSTEVGRRIGRIAADSFKRVTLELGGKSPQIILADADLEAAITGTAMGLFFNQGEVCAAGTRVLVHRSVYDPVVEALAGAAQAQVVGDPFDPATTIGALVSAKQQERVIGYIERGVEAGAKLVAGGPHEGPGYFVRPTIFADATNDLEIAREEIFGPVGTIIPFDDPEEAVRIANDTQYGLAASIWTRDVSLAHGLARQIKAGSVWVNAWGALNPALPWGGMKNSGTGRELGWSGILDATEEKTVTIAL
jgi:acyl-CoA reductase-like NAD-dependent aldehyde dehydrogenase